MTQSWGSFTVKGSKILDDKISAILSEFIQIVSPLLLNNNYEALILIGGYGRGEGGVEIRNDQEYPHNNFDFLLISKNLSLEKQNLLKAKLNKAIHPLIEKHNIGMDIGIIDQGKLKRSQKLVMWHDMYFGHKTILGNKNFITALKKFSTPQIVSEDAIRLLVNRGTLFVINELLLKKYPAANLEIRKVIVKHIVKAVIGYGDALLFFNNNYHWSYQEKQKRMRQQNQINDSFRKLYDDMMEFRFKPCYEKYLDVDLSLWMKDLRELLMSVHLLCEQKRLRFAKLDWDNYLEIAFSKYLTSNITSLRSTAKKALSFVKSHSLNHSMSIQAKWGYRFCNSRDLLMLIFPIIAYHLQNKSSDIVKAILNKQEKDFLAAYLQKWREIGDTNFENFLVRYNISS